MVDLWLRCLGHIFRSGTPDIKIGKICRMQDELESNKRQEHVKYAKHNPEFGITIREIKNLDLEQRRVRELTAALKTKSSTI